MVNFTLFVYSSMVYGLTRLCFGRLRPVETEQLTERAWFAVTETCLAMTVFRDEIGGWFLVMFVALVTGKVWGWIGDARIEVLEQQPPANPRLFHARLSISLALSCIYDLWLLRYTAKIVGQKSRPSMMVMFLFEFAVLTTTSWRTAARYILTLLEQNITKKQMQTRLQERRQEVRQQREAMIQERQRAADNGETPPEDQEPLPNPEDIEEMDIEVPGWAAKGEWVLWLDLIAGESCVLRPNTIQGPCTNKGRHDQIEHILCFLLYADIQLRPAHPHYARYLLDHQRLHQEARCSAPVSSRDA
jgi:E3 ubiquitin-protein ligase synoviolin